MRFCLLACFLLSTLALGYSLEARVGLFRNLLARFSAGYFLGLAVQLWLFFFLGLFFGFSLLTLAITVVSSFLATVILHRQKPLVLVDLPRGTAAVISLFSILLFAILYPLFVAALREIEGNLLTPLGYQQNLVWHWGISEMFLEHGSVLPRNPLAGNAGVLPYHFFSFMFLALLRLCGLGPLIAYKLMIILFLFCFINVVVASFYALSKNVVATIYGTLIFLFFHSGFVNILMLLLRQPIDPYFMAEPRFNSLARSYDSMIDILAYQVPFFGAPIQFLFHPQPHYLWGMGLAAIGYAMIGRLLQSTEQTPNRTLCVVLSLLCALLPLIHAHSAVVLTSIFGLSLLFKYGLWQVFRSWKELLPLICFVPQLLFLFVSFEGEDGLVLGRVIFFGQGWKQFMQVDNSYLAHLLYWVRSPGISFYLGLAAAVLYWFRKPTIRPFIAAAVLWWVGVNVFRFAPAWSDNNKVFIHTMFVFSWLLGELLASWNGKWRVLANLLCFFSICGSLGTLEFFGLRILMFEPTLEQKTNYRIPNNELWGLSRADFEFATLLRERTEKDAIILCHALDERSIVYGLAGRQAFAGLFAEESFFVPPGTSDRVERFYRTRDTGIFSERERIDYIFLGPVEQEKYKVTAKDFERFPLVLEYRSQGADFYLFRFLR